MDNARLKELQDKQARGETLTQAEQDELAKLNRESKQQEDQR